MSNVLRGSILRKLVFLLLLLSSSYLTYSQGCNGADGSGIFTGSIANRDNGTRCANQQGQPGFTPGLMEIDIGNIPENGTVQFQINWDDGSPFQAVNASKIGTNRFFASVTHNFPPNGANVRCEYRPVVRLIFNGTVCNANLGTPPRFVRWNTDDQNTGRLSLLETSTNVNEYLVCAGVETNVTFTDRSTLNCVPPDLTQGPNNPTRWRQFIYGTQNTITGTVRIGGTPRTFPYNGPVDQSPDPVLNSGFPTSTTQIITIPATAQAGQFFQIRMNYWNTCNSFAAGRPPVNEFAYIRVVAQPPAPTPDPANETVCSGTTPTVPRILNPGANTIISWWRNNPGDTPGTLITSGTSRQLNWSQYPGGFSGAAGVYKVWVSYRPNVANGLNCESQKILITRTIREQLTVSNPVISPVSPVCQGTNVSITMPAAATETYGGATNYVFSGTGGLTVSSSTATSATLNTSGVTFAGSNLTAVVNVRVARRYTPSNACQVQRDFPVTVHRTPVGGTPSNFPDVCEGNVIGPINLNGYLGTIQTWQMRTNGGPWNNMPGTAGQASITPGVLTSGSYEFRAVVGNGPCATVMSAIESVTVSPNPGISADAGNDIPVCDVLSAVLNGSNPAPGTGTWSFVSSFPAGKPAPTFSNPNSPTSTVTVSQPGRYTLRWTVESGLCQSIDEIDVDFGSTPVIPALPDIEECGTSATLNAPVLNAGVGTWTVVSGNPASVTIADINQHNSTVTLNGPAFDYGVYVLRWTVLSGNCAADDEDVQVTFYEQPTVSASNVNGVCLDPTGNIIALNATLGGGTPLVPTGSFTVVTGDGTIDNIVSAPGTVTANYNSTNQDYINGTDIVIRVFSSIGGVCPVAQQDFVISVDKTPVAIAGTNPTPACESFIELNATTPVDAVGMWTGPGVTFDDPSDPKTTVRNLPAAPGTVDIRWTVTSTGGNGCSAYDEITIASVAKPNAVDFSPILCEALPPGEELKTHVTLTDFEDDVTSEPVGTRTIQWFENGPEGLGVPVADPAVTLVGVPENKIYVAKIVETVSGSNCTSNAFVTINIRPLPLRINGSIPLCEDAAGSNTHGNVDLVNDPSYKNAVTSASNDVTWFDSFADATNNVSPIPAGPFDVVGNRNVFARIEYPTGEACPIVASLDLIVNQIPVAIITGDPTVCMGSPTTPDGNLPVEIYQTASFPGAKYFWTIPTGPGQFLVHEGGGEGDFFVLLKFPFAAAPNTEDISVRIELEGCSFDVAPFAITRSAVPQAPVIIGDDFVCADSRDIQFSVQNPSANDYTWRFYLASNLNVEGGALVATGQNTSLIRANFQSVSVRLSVVESNSGNNECVSQPGFLDVTVNPLPNMLPIDPVICSGLPSGVEFVPDNSPQFSPVNFYRLIGVDVSGASGVTANPGFPVTPMDGPADMIRDIIYRNTSEIPKAVLFEVAPVNRTVVNGVNKDCLGSTRQITLTVNPEPTLESGLGRNICSDDRTEITLRSGINSYPADRFVIVNIEQTTNPANPITRTGAANIGDEVASNGIFNDRWNNPGSPIQDPNSPFEVTYFISAKSSVTGCVGNPAVPVLIRVFPTPQIDFVNDPVCSNSGVDIDLDAPNVSGGNTNWTWAVESISNNLRGAEPGGAAGGTALINDVVINESFSPGTVVYRVTAVTNLGGKVCSSVIPVSVDVNPAPQVTPIPNTPICSTTPNNGLIRDVDLTALEATIANPALTTIVWYNADPVVNPGATIANPANYPIQNAVPVFAHVTGNSFGCSTVVPVTYTVNNAVALTASGTDVSCNGANDGSILAQVTGGTGTAPYFFRKGNEPFASSPTNEYTFLALAPNLTGYDITVEDSRGCSATVNAVVIVQPTPLTLLSTTSMPAECFFDNNMIKDRNGRIEVVASGSSGSYTYTLSPGGISNQTGIFPGLRPGSYSVVVNDFANTTCKLEFSPVIVTVPDPIEVLPVFIPQDSYGNQVSCSGATNGQIHVTARGGTGEFDFSLDPAHPGNPIRQLANQPAIFTGLGPATYRITITDMNGCVAPQAIATISSVPSLFLGKLGTDQDVCLQQSDAAGDADEFTELISFLGGRNPNPDPNQRYEYIWEHSVLGGPWSPIPGATSKTYDPDANSPYGVDGTYLYRRLIRSVPPAIELSDIPAFCLEYKGDQDIVTINVREKPSASILGNFVPCEGDNELYRLRLNVGTLPVTYTATGGEFTQTFTSINNPSNPYEVKNVQDGTQVGFINIKDFYNCIADNVVETISTAPVDATFTVDQPVKCAGEDFMFSFNNEDDRMYVWDFGDGTSIPYDVGEADGTDSHTYPLGASAQGDATFTVTLTAALPGFACQKSTTQQVSVRQAILLNIVGAPNEICSGETVTMTDNSTGVSSGVWYYTDAYGNRGPDIPGPLASVDFVLNNTGAMNPVQFMLNYEATGPNGCPAPEYKFPVNVYRAVDASFTVNPNPAKVVGGLVTIDIVNTSDPIDFSNDNEWIYGEDQESITTNGYNRTVTFSSIKDREIKFTLRNPARPVCFDTHVVPVTIDLDNPAADFMATRAGCYPLEVKVQNQSEGYNKFVWQLTSTNGINETSTLREPTFTIYTPGTYNLVLTASVEGGSFPPYTSPPKTIEVFAKPLAEFFLRQNQAYTGAQIKPVNQSQFTCSNCYSWDFGDGFTYEGVFEPAHFYTVEGRYTVKLAASVDYGEYDIDDDGVIDGNVICEDETTQDIRIIDGGAIKIPNAFTPNVNGSNGGIPDQNFTNDVFLPIMDGVEEFTMQIFDRWGNMVFQSQDKNIGWDGYDRNGRLMPAGVYVYKLVLRLGDGQRTTKVGDVTLIR